MGTNTLGQVLGRKQPAGFNHSPLAMHPLGLNRIEPRTLRGQQKRQNAHPFACRGPNIFSSQNPR
jgi:hypothetical protein